MTSEAAGIPEVGQAVLIRNRLATVRAVEPYDARGRHLIERPDGALAYAAYQRYSASRDQQQAAPQPTVGTQLALPPQGSGFVPARADQGALGLTLVRAMIAAARADGTMDSAESQAIFGRIEQLGLSTDEQRALVAEMNRPVDMDELVRAATSPEIAAEIYLASLLAIDVDTPAEQGYLSMLAARLQLPQDLVSELHRQAQAA